MNQAEALTIHSAQVATSVASMPEIFIPISISSLGRKAQTDEGKAQLVTQANILKRHEDYGVLIQSYTDQQGLELAIRLWL